MIDFQEYGPEGLHPEAVPPSNTEAEEALLGSVFLDQETVRRIAGIVTPADFYRERNATIFRAMVALHERDEPIDYLTVIGELERAGQLEEIGGVVYLSGLMGAVPTPLHAPHYARMVADAAALRRMISAAGKIAVLGFRGSDPAAVIAQSEQILAEAAPKRAAREFIPIASILGDYLEELGAATEHEGIGFGVPTGFRDLDAILTGGLQRTDLAILAARPAMGKTSLCLCMAANTALRYRGSAAIFSLEMSAAQLVARLLATESGVEPARQKRGLFRDDSEQRAFSRAISALVDARIWIDDTPGLSISEIVARTRRLHEQAPLDLIVVDHLQLVDGGSKAGNRVQEMTDISKRLKNLAREIEAPVLALSQLSRNVEQRSPKIPNLSDLRESGSIEQDADIVMFIYREDYYDRDSDRPGVADIHIAKHRNGSTGQIGLRFNHGTTKFSDIDP